MGNIKKQKKKYETPKKMWEESRLEEEKELMNEFGLKNKKELWKMTSIVRRFKKQAINLIPRTDAQADKERKDLINKLVKMGLVNAGAKMEDILDLDTKSLLNRRLQTFVYTLGYSKTVKQARQFITHGHIFIGDACMDVPSYIVKKEEESKITFSPRSKLFSMDHPERLRKAETEAPKKKKEKPKDKKFSKDRKYRENKR